MSRSRDVDNLHRLTRARAALRVAKRELELLDLAGLPGPTRHGLAVAHQALERGLEQAGARERGNLEECERTLQDVGFAVENRLPAGWYFLVLACTRGAPGFVSHVSNVMREDACALVTEWLAKVRLERPPA
jgi:hypothetical protein